MEGPLTMLDKRAATGYHRLFHVYLVWLYFMNYINQFLYKWDEHSSSLVLFQSVLAGWHRL